MGQLFSYWKPSGYHPVPILPSKTLLDHVMEDNLDKVEKTIENVIDHSLVLQVQSLEVLVLLLDRGYEIEDMEEFLFHLVPRKCSVEVIEFLWEQDMLNKKDLLSLCYSIILQEKAYEEGHFLEVLKLVRKLYGKKLELGQIFEGSYVGQYLNKN